MNGMVNSLHFYQNFRRLVTYFFHFTCQMVFVLTYTFWPLGSLNIFKTIFDTVFIFHVNCLTYCRFTCYILSDFLWKFEYSVFYMYKNIIKFLSHCHVGWKISKSFFFFFNSSISNVMMTFAIFLGVFFVNSKYRNWFLCHLVW